MCKSVLSFLLIFCSMQIFGQDIIVLLSGEISEGKVTEVSDTEIKYQRKELINGPVYSIKSAEVFMIIYENRQTEVLNRPKPVSFRSAESGSPAIEGIYYDSRDGNEYKYLQIGEQAWMAENLRYIVENSVCYKVQDEYCEEYGQYYFHADALNVCPDGWHLATDQDWMELEMNLGMNPAQANDNGWRGSAPGQAPMMLKGGKSKLDLMLSGLCHHNNDCSALGKEAFYWTASTESKQYIWIRHLKDRASVERVGFNPKYKLPVRCVKDN